MMVCKLGGRTTGKHMLQLSIEQAFEFSLQLQKFMACHQKSIDFVLAFPQADLEVPVHMELLLGFDAPDNESQKFCATFKQTSLWIKD